MIFLTPVTAKYTEKNLKITKPLYNEQIFVSPLALHLIDFPLFLVKNKAAKSRLVGVEDCHIWAI